MHKIFNTLYERLTLREIHIQLLLFAIQFYTANDRGKNKTIRKHAFIATHNYYNCYSKLIET